MSRILASVCVGVSYVLGKFSQVSRMSLIDFVTITGLPLLMIMSQSS